MLVLNDVNGYFCNQLRCLKIGRFLFLKSQSWWLWAGLFLSRLHWTLKSDYEIGHVNKPFLNKEGLDSLQLPFMFKCLSMTELVILCFVWFCKILKKAVWPTVFRQARCYKTYLVQGTYKLVKRKRERERTKRELITFSNKSGLSSFNLV